MIHLITGKPRSGKSYLAVKTLSDFFNYDKEADYWILKEKYKELKIITNIEGLLLPHENLDELCEKMKLTVPAFFTKPVQEKISSKHKLIVYALDEAQQYFPDNFRGNDTRFYFEWHGHLGHTIYLMTQDKYRIWRGLSSLSEYETRAVKKSLSIFGEIKYNEVSSGEIVGRKALKPSKDIFDLYCSERMDQPFKTKNRLMKFLVLPVVLFFIPLYLFSSILTGWAKGGEKKSTQKQETIEKNISEIAHPSNKTQVAYSNPYQNKLRITLDSILIDNKPYLIRHPLTNELVPVSHMPYELHFDGRNLYAYMDALQFASYIAAKAQQDNNSDVDALEAVPGGRPSAGRIRGTGP